MLTHLINLIGHCEKEVKLSTLANVRTILSDIVMADFENHPRLSLYHYLESKDLPCENAIEEALNVVTACKEKESKFWLEYRDKVCDDLNTRLYKELTISKKIIVASANDFASHISKVADADAALLAATGKLPDRSLVEPICTDIAKTNTNKICRVGEYWDIAFENVYAHIRDCDGIFYIEYLIRHQGEEIPCQELYNAKHPAEKVEYNTGDIINNIDNQSSFSSSEQHFIPESEEERKLFTKAWTILQDLREQLKEAEEEKAYETVKSLQIEITNLKAYINKEFYRGKSRTNSDPHKKYRDNVTKAIKNMMDKLKPQEPAIYSHLKCSVKTGNYCSYSPHNHIKWTTE